jgi:hypothetical protein
MSEKTTTVRGRPVTNQIDPIPATPEEVAKAIFRSADKKIKKPKPKPN